MKNSFINRRLIKGPITWLCFLAQEWANLKYSSQITDIISDLKILCGCPSIMPNKYPKKKGWNVPKQKYKLTNWSDYNEALRQRGSIIVWLSAEAISQWYEKDRVYDGTGTPKRYSDFAIITCHEMRQVYKLPLRQSQGFIDSIFKIMGLPLDCPDFSTLSKRLSDLNIKTPRYKKTDKPAEGVHAIAIDSTGLKRFGRGEWHNEKYELSSKASWCKFHAGVNQSHYIEACVLTNRFETDDQQVPILLEQIEEAIDHFTGDGAFDKTPVYEAVLHHSPNADVVIPPSANAVENTKAAPMRNRNIQEIKDQGRMAWQKNRTYGRRNLSELAMLRYQKILGNTLHARDFGRQKQEAMIGCGVLNKMTLLGMPASYRSV
jgi:hypothetical protein